MEHNEFVILEDAQEIVTIHEIETGNLIYMNKEARKVLGNDYVGKKCKELFDNKLCVCSQCKSKLYLEDFGKNLNHDLYKVTNKIIDGKYYRGKKYTVMIDGVKCAINTFLNIDSIMNESEMTKREHEAYEKILIAISSIDFNNSIEKQCNKLLKDIRDLLRADAVRFIKYCDNKEAFNYVCSEKNIRKLPFDKIIRSVIVGDYEYNRIYKDNMFIHLFASELDDFPIAQRYMKEEDVNDFFTMFWEFDNVEYVLVVRNIKSDYDDRLYKIVYKTCFFIINSFLYNQGLYALGNNDLLTNLYNKNKYINDLEKVYNETQERIGVIYFDLDDLKETNDQYGHDAGDKLLIDFSEILRSIDCDSCNIYRIGGDEFVVIAKNVENEVFESINKKIHSSIKFNRISCSFGSVYKAKTDSVKNMISEAEKMMYYFKSIHHSS